MDEQLMAALHVSTRVDINGDRLMSRLHTLAGIGRDPSGGISRLGFSATASEANRFVLRTAEKCGLPASIDAGGNLLIRQPTSDRSRPTLLLGSHLDTVVNGGWLDGAYGVIAALEVLQTISENHLKLEFDIAVVAFANEEGALFPQPFWGSMVMSGMLDALPENPTDYHGSPLDIALARAGGDITNLEAAVWPESSILGYLELHVEQGPVLESGGLQIGVVDAIVGRTVVEVDICGVAAHAGTTPMSARSDAIVGASHLALIVEQLSRRRGLCRVATVGRLEVFPNSANTIPGRARLTVDLRDPRLERMMAAESAVQGEVAALATRLDLKARCERIVCSRPALMDQTLREKIVESAEDLGLKYQTLSSGAGHDAQILSTVAPAAMIFVPSIGGVSHVPEENTTEEDLIAGARVLLGTVLRIYRSACTR
jgi:N-carbamoyl-L-amino-acid hydrolase